MPAVVSDASVLIALGRVGKLDLLRDLYHVVTVPPKVWDEVTTTLNKLRKFLTIHWKRPEDIEIVRSDFIPTNL